MTAEAERGAAKGHRTVTRVMTILEAVAAEPHGVKLAALVSQLDAAKSSIHGLVKGLEAIGYLREENGVYTLGPAIAHLLAPGKAGIVPTARPVMEDLNRRFEETVMLATLVGDSLIYVDSAESTQLIRYSAPLRVRRPLWPTSTGKCFLAHLGARRREAYLREHVSDPAAREAAAAELERVRTDGYAFNRGETLPDISAVAAPILSGGRVVACLAVAGPTTRMGSALPDMAPVVRDAARQLSSPRG
jgi:DNA-binding IclR family transcriptional regulator